MKKNIENDINSLKSMFPTVAHIFDMSYLQSLPLGKTEINEDEFCIKTKYNMRNTKDQFFESHRKYIDVHITLSGSELFAMTNIDKLTATSEYDSEGDGIVYDKSGPFDKLISSNSGDVIIFGFTDGHMTAIGDSSDNVEKVIVKVLDENFKS